MVKGNQQESNKNRCND